MMIRGSQRPASSATRSTSCHDSNGSRPSERRTVGVLARRAGLSSIRLFVIPNPYTWRSAPRGARIHDSVDLTITSLLRDEQIIDHEGTIRLPETAGFVEASEDVPDWDAVIGEQPDIANPPDMEAADEKRIAPPDGKGLLVLRSDMPLLELEVQLIKLIDRAESAHGSAAPGTRLVACQFTIRNRGRVVFEPYRTGARWTGEDSSGGSLEATTVRVDPSLHATRIRPGGVGTGFITFEVPEPSSLSVIMFNPSGESDTGIWPILSRHIDDAVPQQHADSRRTALQEELPSDRRVDVMSVSSSGATMSLAIDAPSVSEATELLDAAGIKLKAGPRYTSERRGARQTVFISTTSFEAVERILRREGFDFRPGPLGP
jgi:hypothetical protein